MNELFKVTIFSVPTYFVGTRAELQHNAITSWKQLDPRPDIVLFGNAEGTATYCREHALRHSPFIERNRFDTPLFSNLFRQAKAHVGSSIAMYCSTDVIVLQDLWIVIQDICSQFQEFLVIGNAQEIAQPAQPLSESGTLAREIKRARLPRYDFAAFKFKEWMPVPSIALGKGSIAKWLVMDAISKNIPIVDVSGDLSALHQTHDYKHTKWGTRERLLSSVEMSESKIFDLENVPDLRELCSHCYTTQGLIRNVEYQVEKYYTESVGFKNQALQKYCQVLQVDAMKLVQHNRCERAWEKLTIIESLFKGYPGLPLLKAVCLRAMNRFEDARIQANVLLKDPTFGVAAQDFLQTL